MKQDFYEKWLLYLFKKGSSKLNLISKIFISSTILE